MALWLEMMVFGCGWEIFVDRVGRVLVGFSASFPPFYFLLQGVFRILFGGHWRSRVVRIRGRGKYECVCGMKEEREEKKLIRIFFFFLYFLLFKFKRNKEGQEAQL